MATHDKFSADEGLAFDDVLLRPGYSQVLPGDVKIATRFTRAIRLNLPIVSAAMDTVTEGRLAIAMATAGGLGVIHRNMTPEEQAEEVRKVKRYESGVVVDPITIFPDATLADALAMMKRAGISGVPVVEHGSDGRAGALVGIVTHRDVRFADDPRQPVSELMTRKVVTVREGFNPDEARRLLHQYRIEKIVVIDDAHRCVGLVTVKDIEKATDHPNAAKDAEGRLRVAAATTVGDKGFARGELLIAAGVDALVVDTAHGHSESVLSQVRRLRRLTNKVAIVAGNVATREGAQALIDAGADAIKVGIGPGVDLHDAHRRGRRRAAAQRRFGGGGGGAARRRSGDRGRGRQIFGRRRQGHRGGRGMRDDRLAAGGSRREPRRDVSLSGALVQELSRHGIAGRDGAWARRTAIFRTRSATR